jgi:hypothetical protein
MEMSEIKLMMKAVQIYFSKFEWLKSALKPKISLYG